MDASAHKEEMRTGVGIVAGQGMGRWKGGWGEGQNASCLGWEVNMNAGEKAKFTAYPRTNLSIPNALRRMRRDRRFFVGGL